jgi:hypothetical protein
VNKDLIASFNSSECDVYFSSNQFLSVCNSSGTINDMNERFVFLIYRDTASTREFLLVRSVGATLLQFPSVAQEKGESNKNTVRRGIKTLFSIDIRSYKRLGHTGYQASGVTYFRIAVYAVNISDFNSISSEYEKMLWMDKFKIRDHLAQMSNLMQESILPFMEESESWYL